MNVIIIFVPSFVGWPLATHVENLTASNCVLLAPLRALGQVYFFLTACLPVFLYFYFVFLSFCVFCLPCQFARLPVWLVCLLQLDWY